MNYTILGFNYNFQIIIKEQELPNTRGLEDFCFIIQATCKDTARYSYINNLNAILSYFDIEDEDPRLENLIWHGSLSKVEAWASVTYSIVSDQFYLRYLERTLDEDREEGEWES